MHTKIAVHKNTAAIRNTDEKEKMEESTKLTIHSSDDSTIKLVILASVVIVIHNQTDIQMAPPLRWL